MYDHPDAEDHIAAWEIQAETCPLHGGPRSECPDDERDWFPQLHICYVEMQLEGAKGLYAELHRERPFHDGSFQRWSENRTPDFPFRFDDGTTVWLSPVDLEPGNDFLGRASGSPGGEIAE